MLVVGLGNPGPAYAATRHNLGRRVAAELVTAAGAAFAPGPSGRLAVVAVGPRRVHVLEPPTFMNRSGEAVAPALEALGLAPDALVLLHDELDLPWGTTRWKHGGGLAGHRGLRSVAAALGTEGFARLRLGIGRPPDGDVLAWVLGPLEPTLGPPLAEVLAGAADFLRAALTDGPDAAMRRFHREPPPTL